MVLRELGEKVADEVIAFTELCVVIVLGIRQAAGGRNGHASDNGFATLGVVLCGARAADAALVPASHIHGLPGVILYTQGLMSRRSPPGQSAW